MVTRSANEEEGRPRGAVLIIIGVLVALVIVLSYGITREINKRDRAQRAKAVYQFQRGDLEKFQKGELPQDQFLPKLKSLQETLEGDIMFLPVFLASVLELEKKKQWAQALELFDWAPGVDNPYGEFFLKNKKAQILEDMGKLQEALDVMEGLSPPSAMLFEGKVFLDKGRLYKKLGQLKKAKQNLQRARDDGKTELFTKLANIYLLELQDQGEKAP